MSGLHALLIIVVITIDLLVVGSMIEGYLKEILKRLEELEKK